MPTFDIISVGEAKSRSASGKCAELPQESSGTSSARRRGSGVLVGRRLS